jgi:hypothetical protein
LEQRSVNTFIIVWTNTLLPIAGTTLCQAFVDKRNNPFKINSINWEWRCRNEDAWLGNIPIENNTTQELEFSLIAIPGATSQIGAPFTNPGPLASIGANGWSLTFYKPGQFFFEDFYMFSQVDVMFTQTNRDLVNSVRFYTSIQIQIGML